MIALALFIIGGVLAQDNGTEEVPRPISIVQLKGADEPIHVFADPEEFIGKPVVLVEEDLYPHGTRRRSIRTGDIKVVEGIPQIWKERPSATRRRHEAALREADLVAVDGVVVPRAEAEYAERARQLVRERDQARRAENTPDTPAGQTEALGMQPEAVDAEVRFRDRWPQFALAAVALLLVGLVFRTMVLA